jgi:dTDP-4-dehydrorhamnose reductase
LISPPTHLIIGADSKLGSSFELFLRSKGKEVIGTSRRNTPGRLLLALEDQSSFCIPKETQTAYFFAAVSKLENCRSDPRATRELNVLKTVALSRRLVEAGVRVIFLSTAAVFDGESADIREAASVSPQTEYGRQKAEAEELLLRLEADLSVLRLTKVLSPETPILSRWASALSRNDAISAFSDLPLAPLSELTVNECLLRLGEVRIGGVFHLSPETQLSYFELAGRLARYVGKSPSLVNECLARTSGVELEHLPRYATLGMNRSKALLQLSQPNIDAELERSIFPR